MRVIQHLIYDFVPFIISTFGWRPFSQLSFAQPGGACPWVRVDSSALFRSAVVGQCVVPQCTLKSALFNAIGFF